jgi:hypothetical protein
MRWFWKMIQKLFSRRGDSSSSTGLMGMYINETNSGPMRNTNRERASK